MIERGGGRTTGLTEWQLMDVSSMWACVQDQDTTGQWKQVAGWRKVCDLALAHLSRLREYRRGLAEAWPPETNAAARAYVGELDQLIERVQHTHDAAAANYDALAAAARAIGSARAELRPLYDEYATKLRQKQAYEATVADPKAVAGSRLPERPPVTDDDLERLNVRARGLMTGLSGELQQAQVMLQRPPAPVRPGRQPNDPDAYDQMIPTVPPIIPVALATPAHSQSGTPLPKAQSPSNAINSSGPILGGTGTVIAQPAPGPTTPTNSGTSAAPGMGVQPVAPPITGGGRIWQNRLNSPMPPGLSHERSGPTSPPAKNSPRSALPNGFIGTPPSAGISPTAPNGPRRVNPVGGVIGGGGAGTSPTGGAGSRPGAGRSAQLPGQGLFPAGGSPSGAPVRGQKGRTEVGPETKKDLDPDHPWETSQGVKPVMLPPEEEGPIDPGPAIGLDR
ncbi:hypothetical protein [Micromonospora maritima]|uniref:hypothetical protein n=1 Tax=Micromonospora maritima TaxID=986711 RepID=UPI001FEC236C|nr:hypothetical protein [Micromonospora maritima]